MTTRQAEVVIVGSGVAGSLAAARLARAGVKVLVLEAGPRIARADAIDRFQHALVKVPESPYPETPCAPHPRSDAPDRYYLQDGPDRFGSTYLRQVGGTTWHWLGTAIRFVPDDFRLRSRFGVGVDWPIGYDDLEPWYCEAERELGVAGDGAADPDTPRSRAYPLPPIPLTYLDLRVRAALSGTRYALQPTPQARNSRPHDDRPPCCGSTTCIPICPVQAKYDATVHVARAERLGAEVVERAVVSFLEIGDDGRVTAIRVVRPDGSEEQATGQVFVLAAHGIETPKLLLQSRTSTRPDGVANSSGQVGRNLMDHPTQLSWALAGEPLWPYRGPMSTSGIESTRAGQWRAERPSFRTQVDNNGWNWPKGTPGHTARTLIDRGLRGRELEQALADHSAREIALASMVEQLPSPSNRVVPDFEQRDAIGLPRPRITFRIDDYVRRGIAEARRVHGEIFAALRSTEAHYSDEVMPSGHIIGTCRMGADRRQSVVDARLRSHDHPNLFVLGSSVFPTSAASNPTLTIAALTLRAVGSIQAALGETP